MPFAAVLPLILPEEIHFIDSGNYHYMTRIWLEKISEPFSNFLYLTIIQICSRLHLAACFPAEDGSMIPLWNFHLLKKVILIGPDEEAFSRVEPEIQGKGGVLEQGEASGNGRGGGVCICKASRWEKMPLYISIDKDVLCEDGCRHKLEPGGYAVEVPCWNVWSAVKRNV